MLQTVRPRLLGVAAFAMLAGWALTGSTASAQDNTIDGLDLKLQEIRGIRSFGREGSFPNGRNGIAFETTCCNVGEVDIEWFAPMDARHPFISFLIVRELDGEFEQISDRSFVKHGFSSINAPGCPGSCTETNPRFLGINCSDTYGAENNSDRFWLGPADEIDPWLGTWEPVCSHFDRGEPPVAPPNDCDGFRSLDDNMIQNLGPVAHRIEIDDADLNHPGATYWFYATYIVAGEDGALRQNNTLSRQFIPDWNGSRWRFSLPDSDTKRGSLLRRWDGATLSTANHGEGDGTVFLGSRVTGPDSDGMYRYQYAIHNRDSLRAVGTLSIPFMAGARIENATFRDIDGDIGNDWSVQIGTEAITFSTTDNPVRWNTIYNFSFESDVGPVQRVATTMTPFEIGGGYDQLQAYVKAPFGESPTENLGSEKEADDGIAPDFQIYGGLGTGATAELRLDYATPDTCVIVLLGDIEGSYDWKGGTLVPIPCLDWIPYMTDASGRIRLPMNGPGGGLELYGQFVVPNPAASWEVTLSNAQKIIIDP